MSARGLLVGAAATVALAACQPEQGTSPSSAPAASEAPGSSSATPASSLPPSGAPPASDLGTSSLPPSSATAETGFTYDPPGHFAVASSGQGWTDGTEFAPDLRFPIESPKAFANSQVYGHGGSNGPGGGQCDAANYSYPWHDNFCETRGYATPVCPAGHGHQGQDIRPNSCVKAKYAAVAAETGTITQIATYTVYLTGESGRQYRYLHLQMDKLKVHLGDHVAQGQEIGYVSNNFGDTATTIHLHFEIKEPVTDGSATLTTYVPPYSSLVDAYQRLLAEQP